MTKLHSFKKLTANKAAFQHELLLLCSMVGVWALSLTMWMMLPVRGRVCTRISLMVISPLKKQELGSSPNPGLIRKYGKLWTRDTSHLEPVMVLPWLPTPGLDRSLQGMILQGSCIMQRPIYWKERFAESKDSKSFSKSGAVKIRTLKGASNKVLVNDYKKAETFSLMSERM